MNREDLVDLMVNAIWPQQAAVSTFSKSTAIFKVQKALEAIEAAGVKLVYADKAQAQLIDGGERTSVSIFTPYAEEVP